MVEFRIGERIVAVEVGDITQIQADLPAIPRHLFSMIGVLIAVPAGVLTGFLLQPPRLFDFQHMMLYTLPIGLSYFVLQCLLGIVLKKSEDSRSVYDGLFTFPPSCSIAAILVAPIRAPVTKQCGVS